MISQLQPDQLGTDGVKNCATFDRLGLQQPSIALASLFETVRALLAPKHALDEYGSAQLVMEADLESLHPPPHPLQRTPTTQAKV